MAKVLIVYGSSSGNTALIAEKIQESIVKTAPGVELKNVTDFQPADLENYDVIITGSSTWDDGELQYDFRDFVAKGKLTPPKLTGKHYAVFGCGDSTYQKFCGSADRLVEAFDSWGAARFGDILRIDGFPEDTPNEQALTKWLEGINNEIKKFL